MGDIADDIIDGSQCSWCGVHFNDEHGYPVLCNDCYNENPKDAEEAGLSRATFAEVGSDESIEPDDTDWDAYYEQDDESV